MKILIDMNLSPLWVGFFSKHGIDAVHWLQIGEAAAPDREIFEFAADNGYSVFTHDLDFGALLANRRSLAPSVIQIRMHDVMPSGACGPAVVRCLREAGPWIERGALVTIDPERRRIRMLPVR